MLSPFIYSLAKRFSPNDILSIDIGSANIKMVHIRKRNGNRMKIVNVAIGKTPCGCIRNGFISNMEELADSLRKTMDDNKIGEKNVKIVISGSPVLNSKVIYIKKKDNEIIEESIRNEIIGSSAADTFEQKLIYRITGEVERKGLQYYRVLVTTVPNAVIENYMKLAKHLQLEPVALDIPFSSIARFFNKAADLNMHGDMLCSSTIKGAIAVVDMGSQTTNLSILYKGLLEFNHIIPAGGSGLDGIIAGTLGIDLDLAEKYKKTYGIAFRQDAENDAERIINKIAMDYLEEILDNIKRHIEIYIDKYDGHEVQQMFFVGGGSAMKGFKEFAAGIMKKPVFTLEEIDLNRLDFGSRLEWEKIRYLVNALGIAM